MDEVVTTDSLYQRALPLDIQSGLKKSRLLTESITTDVCLIGGGICGLSAARTLRALGHDVVLLESLRIGSGESGRCGGQILNGFACDQAFFERHLGLETAKILWHWSIAALKELIDECQTLSPSIAVHPGVYTLATQHQGSKALARWFDRLTTIYQYEQATWLTRDALKAHIASDYYVAGLFDPLSGHINPYLYTIALKQHAEQLGAQLFEHSPFIGLRAYHDHWLVQTPSGQVRCKQVVIAGASAAMRHINNVALTTLPVLSHIIATAPLPPDVANRLIRNRAAVYDSNHLLNYFRIDPNNRLLFGGASSLWQTTAQRHKERLFKRLCAVFPELSQVDIDAHWHGYVHVTANRAPDIRRLANGLYCALGFSGHGIVQARMAGNILAEALSGESGRLDVFGQIRHRALPSSAIGQSALRTLGQLYLRLKDMF